MQYARKHLSGQVPLLLFLDWCEGKKSQDPALKQAISTFVTLDLVKRIDHVKVLHLKFGSRRRDSPSRSSSPCFVQQVELKNNVAALEQARREGTEEHFVGALNTSLNMLHNAARGKEPVRETPEQPSAPVPMEQVLTMLVAHFSFASSPWPASSTDPGTEFSEPLTKLQFVFSQGDPSAAENGRIRIGSIVIFVGLVASQEINGSRGLVKGFDEAKERWEVQLTDSPGEPSSSFLCRGPTIVYPTRQ